MGSRVSAWLPILMLMLLSEEVEEHDSAGQGRISRTGTRQLSNRCPNRPYCPCTSHHFSRKTEAVVDTKLTKSAGEHWVCSVMSRIGWGVALTRDGVERTDILGVAPTSTGRRRIEIQVKTCNGDSGRANWLISDKSQQIAVHDDEWFVMVALGEPHAQAPRSFVLPRDHVSAAAWIKHQHWLTEPGVPAGKRNTDVGRARISVETVAGYEDRWDLLEEPTTRCPVLLPPEFRGLAQSPRVGLPEAHPWRQVLPVW